MYRRTFSQYHLYCAVPASVHYTGLLECPVRSAASMQANRNHAHEPVSRLGGCEMAPRLVFLLWHVYGDLGDAWHDMSAAVLQHYIPQLADPSTPAGAFG